MLFLVRRQRVWGVVDLYILQGFKENNLRMRLGTKPKPAQPKKSNGEKLAASVEKLTVDDTPRVKSKNLDVVKEYEKSGMKRMANFVVIGE